MKYQLKYLKSIAYLFALLILLQSCIVYKNKPIPIEEASNYNYRRIKVKTYENGNYKLRWINEEPDAISSIYKTKRSIIDTSRIISIKIYDPEPKEIQLNEALNHKGMVRFKTKDYVNKFFKVEERNNKIYGYRLAGRDTTTVFIPKENIKEVKLNDRGASAIGTLGIIMLPFVLIYYVYAISWAS